MDKLLDKKKGTRLNYNSAENNLSWQFRNRCFHLRGPKIYRLKRKSILKMNSITSFKIQFHVHYGWDNCAAEGANGRSKSVEGYYLNASKGFFIYYNIWYICMWTLVETWKETLSISKRISRGPMESATLRYSQLAYLILVCTMRREALIVVLNQILNRSLLFGEYTRVRPRENMLETFSRSFKLHYLREPLFTWQFIDSTCFTWNSACLLLRVTLIASRFSCKTATEYSINQKQLERMCKEMVKKQGKSVSGRKRAGGRKKEGLEIQDAGSLRKMDGRHSLFLDACRGDGETVRRWDGDDPHEWRI